MIQYTVISFLLICLLFVKYLQEGDILKYPLMEMSAILLCLPGFLVLMTMLGIYACGKLIWEVIKIAKV